MWGEQDSNLRRRKSAELQSAPVGRFGISPSYFFQRTESKRILDDSTRNITFIMFQTTFNLTFKNSELNSLFFEPVEGVEPTTPRLQITCSGQLSYTGFL